MPRAVGEDIMALLVRALLWTVVILAPGGLLLLPFVAVHQFNKSPKPRRANGHVHAH